MRTQRIALSLIAAVTGVALLAGCTETVSGSNKPEPIDLSDTSVIASTVCGEKAEDILAVVASAAAASPTSPHRAELKAWGLEDPSNDKAVQKVIDMLNERVDAECGEAQDGDADADLEVEDLGSDWSYGEEIYQLFDAYGIATETVNGMRIPVLKAGSQLAGKLYCDSVMPAPKYGTVQESLVNILAYPDYAAQVAHVLYQRPEYAKANPWLSKFANASYINVWANQVINGDDATRLEAAKLMYRIARAADKMGDLGTGTAWTSYNVHIRDPFNSEGDGKNCLTVSDEVLPFEVNTQYFGQFRFLGVLIKGDTTCRDWMIGINLEDGRWVIIEVDCTPPGGGSNCTTNCGGTEKCEPGQWWDGDECVNQKVGSLSGPAPEGVGQLGSGDPNSGTQGTGDGTGGNIINGGSPGSQLGGTGAPGSGSGNETVNGGNSGDATDVDDSQKGGDTLVDLE